MNWLEKGKSLKPSEKDIRQLFDEFLQECQFSTRLRPKTISGYKEVFSRFISIMPEITEVRLLTTEMLTEFFKRLQTRERIVGNGIIKKGVKNSTIIAYWSKMNSFFEWLYRKALIPNNPLKNIHRPELNYEDQRALDEESVHKLYSAVTL